MMQMRCLETERVWDLSSGQRRLPIVGSLSHSHSTTDSSFGSQGSARGLRDSVLISFKSAAYQLPDTFEQPSTPIVSRVTSQQSSPIFKPFKSPKQLPLKTKSSIKMLNRSATGSKLRIEPTQVCRRRSTRNNVSKSNQVMSKFSQWNDYKRASQGPQVEEAPAVIKRTTSIKRKNFTNANELRRSKKDRKFLFHKGFLKRNRSQSYKNKVLRNKTGFNAVLDFIDLETFNIGEIAPTKLMTLYKPGNLIKRLPGVTESYKAPIREYVRMISRENSIQRPPTTPLFSSNTSTKLPKFGIKRANSTPPAIRRIRSRSYSPKARIVHDLWKEYLKLVIYQRVQLRLYLNKVHDTSASSGFGSVSSDSYENITRQSISPGQFNDKHHKLYNIVGNDDSFSSASASTFSVMRKAY